MIYPIKDKLKQNKKGAPFMIYFAFELPTILFIEFAPILLMHTLNHHHSNGELKQSVR